VFEKNNSRMEFEKNNSRMEFEKNNSRSKEGFKSLWMSRMFSLIPSFEGVRLPTTEHIS
jgi:hypothetical protein